MICKSSVKSSVLLEDGNTQSLEEKDLTLTSQTLKTSVKLPPQSSSVSLTNQVYHDHKQKGVSSSTLSSCLIPWCHQEASVLQKREWKRKHFLKENTNENGNKENMNLKRKRITSDNLSEKTSKHRALEKDEKEVEGSLKSGNSSPFKNHFCDIRYLEDLEKSQLIETLEQAAAMVVTLMYEDGSTQLRADQATVSSVKGIVVLLKSQVEEGSSPLDASVSDGILEEFSSDNRYIYIKIDHPSIWGQEQDTHTQFARKVLFQMLKCKCPVICWNAKDFVRAVLQFLGDSSSWKQVAGFVGLDPRIAAWLIEPGDTVASFEDLVAKYCEKSITVKVNSTCGNSSRHVLVYGLWQLFCTLEIPLIPILAVMESHSIQVNKEEMERTSALLGSRLKELEHEAHFVAGEQFLITSNHQLREILFGKLKLHLLCPKKTLPRTALQKYPSTSEAVLTLLQDLHPLPKIILEYRQVHKIKSTFVDGLLACTKKGFISATWNQTGTVTGRLSARHPNIQGISKHPIHITKPQNFEDFSQIELRILAHLSGDPELLKLFQESERDDVFSTLTSQWKDIPVEHVKHTDREQTKKVVYSVIYGAGKERLAACLGVNVQEAAQFLESFLHKYKKIKDFAEATIAQCHKTGYVASIMGRRRPLPRIRAQDQRLQAQAERQAVNFVVQGSAADLCKLAMTHIFTAVASSPTLTARLVAQIHDELLFEVEDTQVPEFAALVRATMESLRHVQALELRLQVPLRVSLSAGQRWGSLAPLQEALGPHSQLPPHDTESPSNSQAAAGSWGSTYHGNMHFSPSFHP